MGMSYTGFGAPVTTKNLQANADLNLGNYDLIATDVKGDTAEFDEFVGDVGNFTRGLVSGGFDVSGILHAESDLQVGGNIVLEGSINNVNIDDTGAITTPKTLQADEGIRGKIIINSATNDNNNIKLNEYNVISKSIDVNLGTNKTTTLSLSPDELEIKRYNTSLFIDNTPQPNLVFSETISIKK